MDELHIIETIFKPLAGKGAPSFNLENDTAIYSPPPGFDLVMTKDAMISGVHFLADQNPRAVARRLLRSNLSDLAATGAKPVGYLLAIMGPQDLPAAWLEKFADGLKQDQTEFGISLFGGDTTSGSKSLALSLTALGLVPKGRGLKRAGAKPGDLIFVSGTIGDAWLGLKALKGEIPHDDFLISRYEHPSPRLNLGQGLAGLATASVDVSDGLVADLGHLARASGVAARVFLESVPFSEKASGYDPGVLITAGDDYELVFTAPEGRREDILSLSNKVGIRVTEIGKISVGSGVVVFDKNNTTVEIEKTGYRHFE